MTAGWPCTALRTSRTDGTPEPGTDGSTKPLENDRRSIRSLDSSRNSLRKPSQITTAVIRSRKPSHKLCSTNLFGVKFSGGKTLLTCANTTHYRISRKGEAATAGERYRLINPRASRHIQGAIR